MPNIPCNTFLVAGTKYRREAGELRLFAPGETLKLIREPENKHDPNAIAIHAPVNSMLLHIGYVPAALAKHLSPMMKAGLKLSAVVRRIEPAKLVVWVELVWEKEETVDEMINEVVEEVVDEVWQELGLDGYREDGDDFAS